MLLTDVIIDNYLIVVAAELLVRTAGKINF